jgi:hypothetical protein
MKVFIGSSTESYEDLRTIGSWLEELQLEPLPWDKPGLFLPGENTLAKLLQTAEDVDAAIFIFGEDDRVWYRSDAMMQPRDNVLIEYGLFVGRLGPKRAIICRKGNPKTAADLHGITFITVDPNRHEGARLRLLAWARSLGQQTEDPAYTELVMQRDVLRREREELNQRLLFEQQKSRDLQQLVEKVTSINFSSLTEDRFWKLLFDYDYFWQAVEILRHMIGSPAEWRTLASNTRLAPILERIVPEQDRNPDRTALVIAKTFRLLRRYEPSVASSMVADLLQHIPSEQRVALVEHAATRQSVLERASSSE